MSKTKSDSGGNSSTQSTQIGGTDNTPDPLIKGDRGNNIPNPPPPKK